MKNSDFNYAYHYSNWHSDTSESMLRDVMISRLLFGQHAIYPNHVSDSILEIGCGMGRTLLMLKEAGYSDITGIDIDELQVKVAKNAGLSVHLSDALEFLEQDTRSYNTIYAFDLLEHVAKDKQLALLRMMHTHLSENGFIALQVPNALAPTASFFRYVDFTHTCSFTQETIGFLLHNAGFHFFAVRPQHQECPEVQQLKLPWARLYRHEFLINNFILTPNLVAVAFKTEAALNAYRKNAPVIQNDYPEPEAPKKKQTAWIRLLKKCR